MASKSEAIGATILQSLRPGELVLLGCGKMGGALLEGWLSAGVPPNAVTVADPQLDENSRAALQSRGVRVISDLSKEEALAKVVVLAVKPQIMAAALPAARPVVGADTTLFSIAAGLPIAFFESLSEEVAVIRAMPNTPAAIGKGITALIGNDRVGEEQRRLGEALARVVGDVVWLEGEDQMDAVTAVSGSGPAYVFHMIEALAAAGRAEGLSDAMATRLARATVAGAGALAGMSDESAETLRRNVTSPGGTTAAGLDALMADDGLGALMQRTVAAAARRSRQLGES